ncbi:intraflagellar transport protein 74 homolog isoform X1 [Neodiprion pinetum]|uniref:Intraflagellar transport protein 74 homolog isoform X1 n=2 Tax=Neodiprion lecontei TaxID=441921 RepID=A0A6J0C297_NEOLC|nr:intraflagellar transport protein 74 homolog isoform X1 [Neodiprion lecontei]XP_046485641.1 intraflagellar transport protein 74 homolog isoform X1 [Neodiprion pinetum]
MDLDRPTTGRGAERPLTRWRREQEDVSRPQSRIERPSSRRGAKMDSQEMPVSSNYRAATAATPGRSVVGRPPSASAFSARVLNSASSRVSATSGGSFAVQGRLGTGLPSAAQVNLVDRPITQQGIAGLRPGTNRGLPMTRQVQDRRYYEGLLQLKIRELTQEIAVITRQVDSQSRERATFLHYDKRAKELAAELTELQGQLADYNIVVDKMTLDPDKNSLEMEAKSLAVKNDQTMAEIENLFAHRQQKEQELRAIEREVELEKKNAERIVEGMTIEQRAKYDDLTKQKIELQSSIDVMQTELDRLSNEKSTMEEQIALSQAKQEAVKLLVKISEVEGKRDKLREEEKNRLSPEEERIQLLAKVKQDNADVAAAERQTAELKRRIAEAEHELEQLETDLEECQSARHVKYKEMRKREEAMEQFMATFDRSKHEELERLDKLETTIVEHLTQISNCVSSDTHLTPGDELAILNIQHAISEDPDVPINVDQTIEGLSSEHTRLQQNLIKMQSLEKRLKVELTELKEKIGKKQSELLVLEDLDGLKARFEQKREEMIAERAKLREREPSIKQELASVRGEYEEIKSQLDKNETYVQISSLEDKLEKLKQNNETLQKFIREERERVDYNAIKSRALELVDRYNVKLRESVKGIH